MTGIRQLALALATVTLSWTAADPEAAEVYRWVDDEGVTHYSSSPPPGQDADRIDASNPPADDPEASQAEIERLRQSNRTRQHKRRLEREAEAREEQQQQEKQQYCSRLHDKRRILINSARVREQADGGGRVLTREEREERLREIEQLLDERCDDA